MTGGPACYPYGDMPGCHPGESTLQSGPMVGVALVLVVLSLWVRRKSWRSRWEVGASLNVLFLGVAMFLVAPAADQFWDRILYPVTGMLNLEDCAGGICFVFAVSCVVDHTLSRLTSSRRAARLISPPVLLGAPLMLVFFLSSENATQHNWGDPLDIPLDAPMRLYWLTMCLSLAYLLVLELSALNKLRGRPESRLIANGYIAACAFALLSCFCLVCITLFPRLHEIFHGRFAWSSGSLSCILFALTSAYSWNRKARWYAPRVTRRVTPRLIIGWVSGKVGAIRHSIYRYRAKRRKGCERP